MTNRTTAHHRPVRRAASPDASYDYAYDAGQLAYQNELLQQQVEDARRKLAPPPRRKQILNWFWTVLIFGGSLFFFFWLGQLRATTDPTAADPLPTAALAELRQQAPAAGSSDSALDQQPTDVPPTADSAVDEGIAAYNLAQQATATALQAPPEATPLPEPGTPDFSGSFQEATCPPAGAFYTPLKGSPCYGRAGQPPLPQSGDTFADSFH